MEFEDDDYNYNYGDGDEDEKIQEDYFSEFSKYVMILLIRKYFNRTIKNIFML